MNVAGIALLALRGGVAIAVLTTFAGGIPRLVQLGLVVAVGAWTALVYVTGGGDVPVFDILAALREVTIGASLGIAAAIPLLAAQAAGRLVDGAAWGRAGPYSAIFGILAAAVFVGIDGHAMVIRSIVESFRAVPPQGPGAIVELLPAAIRLAVPWLVTAAVVEIAIGSGQRLASRAAIHAPTAAAVPAAIAVMTATLVGTLAVAIAASIRHLAG